MLVRRASARKRQGAVIAFHDTGMSDYTLVYDGGCRICTRIADALRRWDKRGLLEIVPAQTPGVQLRFPWISATQYAESLQLVAANSQTWQGAAAIEELLHLLPRGRLIGWIFHIPLVRGVAEVCYRWFARNRYRLGCSDHCKPQR